MRTLGHLRLYRFSDSQKPFVPSTDVKEQFDHMLDEEKIEEETERRKQ